MVTGFYVALAGAGIALGCLTPSPTYEYEWFIDKKRSTQNRDMRLAAVDAVDPLGAGNLHVRKEQYTRHGIWVEYAGSNGHIFTPERLQEICEMEATFYRPAEYRDVCVLDDDGQCAIPPLSIVGQFYGHSGLAGLVRNGTGTCDMLETAEVEATWRSKDMSDNYEASPDVYYSKVFYTFGVGALGKQNYNEYKPDYKRGYAKWSDSFDLHVPAARTAFKGFCDAVRAVPCSERECSEGLLHMPGNTICFYEEFERWKVAGLGNSSFNLANATANEFYGELTLFRETTYPGMMLGQEPDGSTWKDYIGFVAGRLRYVTVPTSLTMKQYRGIQERRKVINRVINFVEAQQESAPSELGHLTCDGGEQFLWTDTMEALRASLFEGLAICFPLAFVVLLFSTENLLVALYAIFGIALIVASVLGTIEYVYGWDLGVPESLMGNLVVGFSVDYTIHLGHMFAAAGKEHDLQGSVDRFSFAIRKMGGTVVGGAVTTLGAGLFMLPCQLVFFHKLGLLMVTTIVFSLLYSFGFVMPLLAAVGPSGDRFAFRPLSALKRMVVKVHGVIMGDSDQ